MTATTKASLGPAALYLAERGWAVLPLQNGGKGPRTARGVHDATTDAVTITRWWRRWPGANIGARVPAGLVVLDVDPRNGGADSLAELTREYGPLPTTLTVWSGRDDGGRHLYYRRPAGNITGRRLPPGIDLKTDGGYLVVPPSTHPATGQPYRWESGMPAVLPTWATALLRPETTGPLPPCGPVSSTYAAAAVRSEVQAVMSAQPGGRNHQLNRSAFALGTLVGSGQLTADDVTGALLAAAEASGLLRDDGQATCERTIASGLRAGIARPRGPVSK